MDKNESYALLDSGGGQKLERFGQITLIRPCSLALWKPQTPALWNEADATFTRERGWEERRNLPREWVIAVEGLSFKLKRTEFGHLGIFPEFSSLWQDVQRENLKGKNVLNLFAYSGGATLACAASGAQVCHLDAAKGMVQWARENAALNNMENAPIRWIVEDVQKFIQRLMRRREHYDAVILDPPTFGRGSASEIFKIENALYDLLRNISQLLTKEPLFVLLSCHTPGYTPLILTQLMQDVFGRGKIESGELTLRAKQLLPSASFAKWTPS